MYFIFSDVHGCYKDLITLLTQWDIENEKLVFLGDAVDRGEDSYQVVRHLMDLKEEHGDRVILLVGNHDIQFLDWVKSEDPVLYYSDDVRSTVKSFYKGIGQLEKYKKDTIRQKQRFIRRRFAKELRFMRGWKVYHEEGNCIFVHAGINLGLKDWRKTSKEDFVWIRDEFYNHKKSAPKRVYFGHTPTAFIRQDSGNHTIWKSQKGDKVGIDGACVFGGQLNGVKVAHTGEILKVLAVREGELIT